MKNPECYDNWRKQGKKAETLDQAMYILLNEITKRSLLGQVPREICDDEIEDICSLRESFEEFTREKLGTSFDEIKCEEITSDFLEAYREFIPAEEPGVKYCPATVHFMTIGDILYLSSENGIANWDEDLLKAYKGFNPILL